MLNVKFKIDDAAIAKLKGRVKEFCVEFIQDISEQVVEATPVKTGFLRASWYASLNSESTPAAEPTPATKAKHAAPAHGTAQHTPHHTAPPAPGFIRLYHGGENPTAGGPRWVTPNQDYARHYGTVAAGQENTVHFVDVLKSNLIKTPGQYDTINNYAIAFEAPASMAKQLKLLK